MMRQMREVTKPIMLLAAGAFVALMVFEWGMDASGRSSGGFGEIGRVNGAGVAYDDYMAAYRNLYDQRQRAQEEPITSQQNRDIEDAAWEEVVNQILIRQELKRRGISVSDDEIRAAAQYNPPQDLRPQFVDSEGRFDPAAYQAYLAQAPQDMLLMLEAYYRDVIPRGKLLRQVSSGIFLSDAELWRQYRDQYEQVEVRYVPFNPSTRFADSLFTVSDADARRYYDEHEDEFEVPARAQVKVVVLGKAPTVADSTASQELAASVLDELRTDGDWNAVAARESSDQSTAQSGGDLGVFPKGRMVPPFDSTVFAARPGTVTGPVRSSFGWHVIEVQERWGQDSARARHVLIPIARTDDSEIGLLTMADSLEDLSEEVGLEAAARTLGLTVNRQEISATFPFVTGAGQIGEGADWIFEEATAGDVSPVFENGQAFYALEVVSSEPEGLLAFEDARPAIEATLVFDRKMARGAEEAATLRQVIGAGEALPNAAAEAGLEVRQAGPFSRNDFVPGLGRQNAAIGAAFGSAVGSVSDVVKTPANVFLIEVLRRQPADSLAWLDQRDQQRQAMVASLQQQRLQEWITALRDAARIVDRRAEVLQPADDEDQPQLPMMF